ncbi:uncharacterized protein B0H18DRAFT_1206663 [Fomitopsis serialis]|uniref:uncharacterized protein n=1 Tax=Fomitopsis serialis TaxID=139415 RepID=UPI002008CE91|nr:uncharacterized protein B0H18DRAFT_1206663 [Neoantrodia serialis]KAH9936295.1 hypothetical protein B0H18DRAFT_1206663 [Neoantrodia serialis]
MSSAVVGDPYLRLMPQDSRCWIYHLPTELLVQIFRIVYDCVPDDGKRHFPELSISHVSKLWRDIAINLPTLWTAFDFPDDLRHNKAAIYLERSKRAPLEIVITLDGGEGKADARTTTELLEKLDATMTLVIPHITRWNSLDIMAFDYSFIHPTLIQLGACVGAPMLEVLRISNYALNPSEGVGEEFKRQDFVLFHGNVPSLKCVDLVGVHVNWTTSIFLSGLKELHLSCHAEDLRPLFKDFARI